MKKCGIYKIISPCGSIYIGQSKDIEKRFSQYKRLQCKCQKTLYNSLLKYGVENHIFEIVLECLPQELNQHEIRLIQENNSYEQGLNMTKGGEVSPMSHPEIVAKIIGRKCPEDCKLKISNSLKKRFASKDIPHNRLHSKHSLETIEKIRTKIKERDPHINQCCKKVYCTLSNRKWLSMKDCWEDLYFTKFSLGHFRSMLKGTKTNTTSIQYLA